SALKIDEEFHHVIVETAGNSYIDHMLAYLQSHVRRLFFHNSIILTESSIDEHETIIKLLKEHNAKKVSEVMRKNWLRAIEEFRTFQEKYTGPPLKGSRVIFTMHERQTVAAHGK